MVTTNVVLSTLCPGCALPTDPSPPCDHPYLNASAQCWESFGILQVLEMESFGYPDIHSLVVDAYAASHPGTSGDRRDLQSVFLHLSAIYVQISLGARASLAREFRAALALPKIHYPQLTHLPFTLNLLHLEPAPGLTDYENRTKEWASAVWEAYSPSHETLLTNPTFKQVAKTLHILK